MQAKTQILRSMKQIINRWSTSIALMLCALTLFGQQQRRYPRHFEYPATLDTEGKHVNAHGGSIFKHGDQWLWYGEARPERGFTSVGVALYTAPAESDMSNPQNVAWTNQGIVLSVVDEAGNPIERGCIIERPKVLWNERDKQFVMLFHLELKGRGYDAAMTGFATSPTAQGPFRLHHAVRPNPNVWPANFTKKDIAIAESHDAADYPEWWTDPWRKAIAEGMFVNRDFESGQMSRDMTVFRDDDGTVWHIFSSEDNLTIHAAELTSDYLGYTGRYYRIAPGGQNEAPTIVKHDGTYWLLCSGCTGWEPNEARLFSASSIAGPWTQHPSPCKGRGARRTYGAQGTWILDSGSNLLFMADVWNPRSLANSRHLWIPITFEDGKMVIEFGIKD